LRAAVPSNSPSAPASQDGELELQPIRPPPSAQDEPVEAAPNGVVPPSLLKAPPELGPPQRPV